MFSNVSSGRSTRLLGRIADSCAATALLGLCALSLFVQGSLAATGDALTLHKNYFVTGDYVIGGVGMRGWGMPDASARAIIGGSNVNYSTDTIHLAGVPADADIVAAYLYWETLESSANASAGMGLFRGKLISGDQIAPAGTLACRGVGDNTDPTFRPQSLRVYRADVLRYLPFTAAPNGAPTSRRLVNDSDLRAARLPLTVVTLPDRGKPGASNQPNQVEGASLVVVYRSPNLPLRSVVIYDGGYTMDEDQPGMSQSIVRLLPGGKRGRFGQNDARRRERPPEFQGNSECERDCLPLPVPRKPRLCVG